MGYQAGVNCVQRGTTVIRFAVAAFLSLFALPAAAQTWVHNVNGYTIGADGSLIRFRGLIIGPDGRVSSLLRGNTGPRFRVQNEVDGGGRTLLPGLIDAHGHVMRLGQTALELDLSEATSLPDALARIRAYAAAHPDLPWITGFGWNQERWGLGRFPTGAELDGAVPDRPVWLVRADGHAGWANGAALRAAHVTPATPAPSGGRVEPDGGVFVDAARRLIEPAIPAPTDAQRDRALAEAQRILLGYGITATYDMGTSPEDWAAMRRAGEAGRLNVRIGAYAFGVPAMRAIAPNGPTPWLYGDRLRMIGVKLYSDGALGSRGAWLKQDYLDAPGQHGLGFLSDAELRAAMSEAASVHLQVAVHAIGDAANAQLLDAIEDLSGRYGGDRRWRVEHAQIVDPADLPRFGRHGIVASMQPVHQTSDWRMAEARMGLPRLGGAYDWRAMLDNHVPLAFGSDYPVESPNPFPGLVAAISRQDAEGQPPGGWQPQQRLTREEAFAAFTTGAAYAGFAEDKVGTLLPGRTADFILVDRDIFADRDPRRISGAQVLETWVGGRRVWASETRRRPASTPSNR